MAEKYVRCNMSFDFFYNSAMYNNTGPIFLFNIEKNLTEMTFNMSPLA